MVTARSRTGPGIGKIRSHAVFEAVRRSGTRGRAGPVTVVFLEQTTSSQPCVAYAIGRKVGGAVVRNRLRRQLRAIVSVQSAHLPAGAYLVNTGPGAAGMPFDELRNAMNRALRAATGHRTTGPATGDGGDHR